MDSLLPLVRSMLSVPVSAEVTAMAERIRAQHPGTVAVLVYGSSLRGVPVTDTLIDFYLIVESANHLGHGRLVQILGRLVPPNVYYTQIDWGGRILRAKYAIIDLAALHSRVSTSTRNPYFWARFSQPMAFAFARDDRAKHAVWEAVARAIRTALAFGRGLDENTQGDEIWRNLFAQTYRTELRPESAGRHMSVVDANLDYYCRAVSLAGDVKPVRASWPLIRLQGKVMTMLRLAKAAYTFSGGADYVAWKIERHTGERITVSEWQRRHPLLAGIALLPRLLRKGVVR